MAQRLGLARRRSGSAAEHAGGEARNVANSLLTNHVVVPPNN